MNQKSGRTTPVRRPALSRNRTGGRTTRPIFRAKLRQPPHGRAGTPLAPTSADMTKSYSWLLIGPDQQRPAAPDPQLLPTATNGKEGRLFVRGDESVRIITQNRTLSLNVFGPGRVQKIHEFSSTAALAEFLDSFEQQMLSNGWMLSDVSDRRKVGRTDQARERTT
jgi:hypothetical protein